MSIEKKNRHDLKKIKQKYFIKKILQEIKKIIKKKDIITINEKINRIPKEFLTFFNQESYLIANPDVKKNALEHFIFYGYDEVKSGTRRIGNVFPFMSELEYLAINPDLEDIEKFGIYSSVYNHFLRAGYQEFLTNQRIISSRYPLDFDESILTILKDNFDLDAYVEANADSSWEHFIAYGLRDVQEGKRTLHYKLPKMSESEYIQSNFDILQALNSGKIQSALIHYLLNGYKEMLDNKRKTINQNIYTYHTLELTKKVEKKIKIFKKKPLISVIMPVYNVDPKWLERAIDSLEKQWYTNWELCIADDNSTNEETVKFLESINNKKIKMVFMEKNQNISGASNEALKLASGEFVALMDNDDELTPDAFYEVVKAINEKDAEFIYSDEDKLELDGTYSEPHFKPDFSPDMFLSQNYISHLGVIRKELIEKVNGWEIGLEGAQDYDLYLKVLEHTDNIIHIPKVLYHWRKVPGSTASEFNEKSYAQEAGVKALQNAIKRRKISAEVKNGKYPGTYRVQYQIQSKPLVSIIIPFKDMPALLDMCINSILKKSTYKNFEIIGISNNSRQKETFQMMESLKSKDNRISFYEYNIPFNYSAINNYAVKEYAKGEHVILLNNDIEIITPSWIEAMLEFSQREDIGAVGAKLYYPNDTIQHAGVTIGVLTLAGHNFRHAQREIPCYMGRESVVQNVSAVTGACLMVKQSIYNEIEGLNQNELKIAFNDIDFCLRIQEKGYLNLFTPYCEAYHYESISRGEEDSPEKLKRFNSEVNFMKNKYNKILNEGDIFYNSNLTLNSEDFSYRF